MVDFSKKKRKKRKEKKRKKRKRKQTNLLGKKGIDLVDFSYNGLFEFAFVRLRRTLFIRCIYKIYKI